MRTTGPATNQLSDKHVQVGEAERGQNWGAQPTAKPLSSMSRNVQLYTHTHTHKPDLSFFNVHDVQTNHPSQM